ncbi:MAG: hypothetical protein LBB65_02925 [Burkholderiales bacterium]|jgi:hypothetical protein|nr:hypothetical protein [Burkholderiales bacterium]
MNTFKKKALFAALTGLGVMGMVGSAQAVNLNPDGLGQALIYPYYTVRDGGDQANAFNSLISIVNSTSLGKAVKVRVLEGKASMEVLDFNLYLSPFDVWTASFVPMGDGGGLITTDNSCTSPAIPAGGVAFRNYAYTGTNQDLADQTLNRTKEGYVELIEMADIPLLDKNGQSNATLANITHVNGVPKDCSKIIDNGTRPAWVDNDLDTGTGGLFGGMTLINPTEAQGVAFEAVALDGFFSAPPLAATFSQQAKIWDVGGSVLPNLADVTPKISTVVDGTYAYISQWDASSEADAVSAVLMNLTAYNEFVLDATTASKTDWVITFPTKRHYYEQPDAATHIRALKNAGSDRQLFQRTFIATGACDDVGISMHDREEATVAQVGDFSPTPPQGAGTALCWEANVVSFGSSAAKAASLFHAENRVAVGTNNYENGWASFTFAPNLASTYHYLVASGDTDVISFVAGAPVVRSGVAGVQYDGLPMVGFAVQQFNNGTLSNNGLNVWATYDGRIAHRFSKSIN